jgi:hypothetical protein
MPEITDDGIQAMADRLTRDADLDSAQRDAVVLAVQRLVWPPSPWPFLHEGEHVVLEIGRHDGGGWYGELLCPHGCGRCWRVSIAANRESVHAALAAAHEEYRTGKTTAVAASIPDGRNLRLLSLDDVLGRAEHVEVQDERLTAEGEH